MIAVGQLPDLAACDIDHKDVQPAIVVEAGESFAVVRLIKVAGDHDWIAGRVLSLGAGHCIDERDALAIGRPGDALAG